MVADDPASVSSPFTEIRPFDLLSSGVPHHLVNGFLEHGYGFT